MNTASNTAESTLTDLLMQVVMILDVVLVIQVELLRVQLDTVALVRRVISTRLEKVLEVLAAESYELLRLLANHLFDEVLEDARERIRDFDLLRGKNAHLTNVGHSNSLGCFSKFKLL